MLIRNVAEFIDHLCKEINCETASQMAKEIFSSFLMSGVSVRVDTLRRYASASVYIACKRMGLPVVPSKISEISGVEKSELLSAAKTIMSTLGISLLPSPEPYVDEIIETLGLDNNLKKDAMDIYHKLQNRLSSRSPRTVAAAIVYYLCNTKGIVVSQREICSVTGITDVSLRDVLKVIKQQIGR